MTQYPSLPSYVKGVKGSRGVRDDVMVVGDDDEDDADVVSLSEDKILLSRC